MGLLGKSNKKNKKTEVIHLNEAEMAKYKVKQYFDSQHPDETRKKKTWGEERELALTEEGLQLYSMVTGELISTTHWRDMKWFEVRPASKDWYVDLKDSTNGRLHFHSSKVVKIHGEAQEYLKRYIRNTKLSLYQPVANSGMPRPKSMLNLSIEMEKPASPSGSRERAKSMLHVSKTYQDDNETVQLDEDLSPNPFRPQPPRLIDPSEFMFFPQHLPASPSPTPFQPDYQQTNFYQPNSFQPSFQQPSLQQPSFQPRAQQAMQAW